MEILDSKDRIARSNIYSVFGNLMSRRIHNNDDGEILLKTAGISSLYDKYKEKLQPYKFNKGYPNNNPEYSPIYVCLSVCEQLEQDEEALQRFLNKILENITSISDDEFRKLSNYLEVIGYTLIAENDEFTDGYKYSLVPSSDGTQERNSDISYLHSKLSNNHPELLSMYDEAISNFGNGQYISCIENCRSLFESFFKNFDSLTGDYVKGILAATGESIVDNGSSLTSIKKIYTYWIDNKKGANRFRLFQTMYSVMSGLGTHREDVASKEDALLLLRYTEDCLLWCFRKGIA